MKTDFAKRSRQRPGGVPAWIDRRLLCVLALSMALAVLAHAAAPSWWTAQGVHNGRAANDYAVANLGQLKRMARAARDELVAKGHFTLVQTNAINTMVDTWSTSSGNAQDYAPANLGQLKAVAAPFYELLDQDLPWEGAAVAPNDYAVANIGQLKAVFSFAIPSGDTDTDGIPDDWETTHFGSLTRDLGLDTDGDGVSDHDEWTVGTNPRDWRSHPGAADEAAVLLSVYTPLVR